MGIQNLEKLREDDLPSVSTKLYQKKEVIAFTSEIFATMISCARYFP